MPTMTNTQKIEFLKHLHAKIFTVIRFPFAKLNSGELQPGSQQFIQLVTAYQQKVQQITTDPQWAPWVNGDVIRARAFNCKFQNGNVQLSAGILIGFDVGLDLGLGHPYPIRVIEQNPYKRDRSGNFKETAMQAQRGDKIMWIIKTDTEKFLGKVQNGEFVPNQPRAYTATNFQPLSFGAGISSPQGPVSDQYGVDFRPDDAGNWVSDVPDVDPNEVPFGVV